MGQTVQNGTYRSERQHPTNIAIEDKFGIYISDGFSLAALHVLVKACLTQVQVFVFVFVFSAVFSVTCTLAPSTITWIFLHILPGGVSDPCIGPSCSERDIN